MSFLYRDHIPRFFETAGGNTLAMALPYLVFSGLTWTFCYVLFRQHWLHRKIVMHSPGSTDVRCEVYYSCVSLLILGLIAERRAAASS